MYRTLSTLIFFLLLPATTLSQNFPIQHYTTENGLPSNNVYSVYRDSKGFLWMGTDKGVVKYNGIEFERYTTNDGLADNEVFFFQEDYEGRLWMSCYNGQLCYHKDGVFHTEANTDFLKAPCNLAFPTKIKLGKDSSITMLLQNCHVINIKNNRVSCFSLRNTIEEDLFCSIQKLSPNRYTVLCPERSYTLDSSANIINKTAHTNDVKYTYSFIQNKGYLFTSDGVYTPDERLLMRFTNKDLINSYIYGVTFFDNQCFTCTNDGLFINNETNILKRNKISCITQDIEGNYWISSLNNGVFFFPKEFQNMRQFNSIYTGSIIYARAIGNQLFFTNTDKNFYRLDDGKQTLLFNHFKHFGKYYKDSSAWKNYTVAYATGLGMDSSYCYYSIEQFMSFIIEKANTAAPELHILNTPDLIYSVKDLLINTDNIYIRSVDYVSIADKQNIKSNRLLKLKKLEKRGTYKRFYDIAVDKKNALWYSTQDSVYKIKNDIPHNQYQFGKTAFKWMDITNNYLVGISHKNQLVLCTEYDSADISMEHIPGNDIIWDKIYKINDSTILVSTDNLYRLLLLHAKNGKSSYMLKVIENRSLPIQAEYICCNDSVCYFFKKGNITEVQVKGLNVKHHTPQIFFRTLKTRKKEYPVQQGLVVSFNESKNITISFTPFSFGSKHVICEYSISKDTTDYWLKVNNNEINLYDASFGDYIVKVRARNLSGNFSRPSVFMFTVSKPFWATWWFILLCVLVFTTALVLIFRSVSQRKARKRDAVHKNEIKFLKAEYKALNALMNPHFIFNTLNNLQWLINNDDKVAANHYLRVFSDLVRQNMHNISKERIPLRNEVELVRNYLNIEKLRFKEALDYQINIEDDFDLDMVTVPPLLIQPLAENAIKHGLLPVSNKNNKLTISIYERPGKLFIDISDNGIGFNESQKQNRHHHKSTGLLNIKRRVEKLSLMHSINITLSVNELKNLSGAPIGTLARVIIDIKNE